MNSFSKTLLFLIILLANQTIFAQSKTENVFIIMTDGFRWQELFGGADSTLIFSKEFTPDSARTVGKFWAKTATERREKLLPFFWSTIANKGQLYGNRWAGNKVNVLNPYWFSYPGYNEVLTGYPDDNINSNDKIQNKNTTVLEFLNNQPKFKGKVAAFGTWDVFPFIINENRSKIPVNAGVETVKGNLSEKEALLNQIQTDIPSMASDRFDFVTYHLAKEYVKKNTPKVMFLSFDETDEFAHESKYREYLFAANNFDKNVADLWNFCQNHPQYKDKTTFIFLTDHGRGDKVKKQWTSHGQRVSDCYQIWIAAIGPDTKPLGEVKTEGQLFQNQVARTAAKLLGFDFLNASTSEKKTTGEVIESMLK
ncbi:phosphoglyceromutase [Emticicia sp.]|uniref:phosphoglyceromutase n=1 Tax=Emticicia sp. TaxID=1930953 RepID=UPI00375165C6